MNLLTNSRIDSALLNGDADGPYLRGWYPGYGEDWIIQRLPAPLQGFLADAAEEYEPFVEQYLMPTLSDIYFYDRILSDLSGAITALELEEQGLGSYDDLLEASVGLGEIGGLGGVFKKLKKAVKKVAKKVIAPIKKVAEKITPKPILNLQKKVAKAVTKVHTKMEKVQEKVEHVAGQIGKKYGNTIITAAGVVLAPFTGGASLAAAAALTAANTAYQKKRAADQAKKLAKADAAKLQQEAAQAEDQLMKQVDDFYNQNKDWFLQRGITPDKWSHMTLQQKIDAINAGTTSSGAGSGGATAPTPMPYPPSSGGASAPSGGGGGASFPGGGGDPFASGGGGGGGGAPSGSAPSGQKVSTASMFGNDSLMPILAISAAVAYALSGKGGKGGGSRRRPRRNPRRRMIRRRW